MCTFLTIQNKVAVIDNIDDAKAVIFDMLNSNMSYDKETKKKMRLHVNSITSIKYLRKYYAAVLLCMHTPRKSPRYKIYDTEEWFQRREDNHIEVLNRPMFLDPNSNWLNTTLKKDREIKIQ